MKKKTKLEQVKMACEEFVKEHSSVADREFEKREIEEAIQKKLDFELTYKVSDFAKPECLKPHSLNNGEYFVKIKHGIYKIKV